MHWLAVVKTAWKHRVAIVRAARANPFNWGFRQAVGAGCLIVVVLGLAVAWQHRWLARYDPSEWVVAQWAIVVVLVAGFTGLGLQLHRWREAQDDYRDEVDQLRSEVASLAGKLAPGHPVPEQAPEAQEDPTEGAGDPLLTGPAPTIPGLRSAQPQVPRTSGETPTVRRAVGGYEFNFKE